MSDGSDNLDHMDEETRKRFQQELQEYQEAVKAEFELASASDTTGKKVVENGLEYFSKNVPLACAQIVFLAQHSTSDATRLGASKYIIDRVFKGAVDSKTDPVGDILKKLMAGEPVASEFED